VEIGHHETAVMDVPSIAGPMLRENKTPSTRNIYREPSYLYLFRRSPQHQHQWRRENHNWDRNHAKPPYAFHQAYIFHSCPITPTRKEREFGATGRAPIKPQKMLGARTVCRLRQTIRIELAWHPC